MNSYVGLYGTTAIEKAWCAACNRQAFVIGGKMACCDAPVDTTATRMKVEVSAEGERRGPSKFHQRKQLELQEGRCLYCDQDLDGWVFKNGRPVKIKTCWDHFVPFSYLQENPDRNFVAACQVCNGIKSDLMFQTVDEARVYIIEQRNKKDVTTNQDDK